MSGRLQNCPLCRSSRVEPTREVQTHDIARIYASAAGFDVTREFLGNEVLSLDRCLDCDCAFFNPPTAGSASFYDKLQDLDSYYPDSKHEYVFAAKFVRSGDSVLEVGCGKGAFAKAIPAGDYVGLEYSERAVQAARGAGLDVRNQALADYAAGARARHDVVCMFQVLEHVPDVHEFIGSALSCVKPGGLLIVSVPSADSFLSDYVNDMLNLPPHHVTRWSNRALESVGALFELDRVAHEHEPLADEHLLSYLQTVVLASTSARYRRSPPLADLSMHYRVRARFAARIAKWVAPAMRRRLRPVGHTVTWVYRKRQA